MIEIKPDPQHPRGGFAEINIQGATAPEGPVTLSVYNSYQQKWLGPSGWQPNKAALSARSAIQDGDMLRLIVGPDVVNQIEEDTPIRIEIGDTGWDTYWPDDINSGPDEAIIGDIGGKGSAPDAKGPTAVVAGSDTAGSEAVLSQTETIADPVAPPTPRDETEDENNAPKPTGGSRLPLILGGIAAVLIAAAVAWFLFLQPEAEVATAPPDEPDVAIEDPPVIAQPVDSSCSVNALNAVQDAGFNDLAAQMRVCGGALSTDDALRFVEQAANANDPDALALFGALYDSGVTDDAIEDTIGLTFSDQPERAAEYYARAVAAGSQEAPTRLQAVCRRLLLKTDTLSQSAREDYCQ